MFGNLSYLFSIIIFAVPAVCIEWIFFYNLLKRSLLPILINIICGLIIVSISEPLGIYMKVWQYGTDTTFKTLLLGVKLESYLYVIIGSVAVSSIVVIYSNYQDNGVKNIFIQGFKDLLTGKYAFWRKQ